MRRGRIAAVVAAFALAAQTAVAPAATSVSSNWSGYAVTGTSFRTVTGSWVVPTANCSSSTAGTTASAFWIGLGGDSEASNALEQAGTETDCLANGTVNYSAWYELVPAASQKARLAVSAGDRIAASVRVEGTAVTVELRNMTTGAHFARTLRMSAPDTSSAEWIAEAPSALTPGGTTLLPLTDFGTVRFTDATATSATGHTGAIADNAWTATRIVLRSNGGGGQGPGPFGQFTAADTGAVEATPSRLTTNGSAFRVTWSRSQAGSAARPPAE
jgi:hypothetical protein